MIGGISDKSYELIYNAFVKYPMVEEVILFGSRAKGDFKNGSDIDLAIKGHENLKNTAWEISSYLNETLPIPYTIDVLDYNNLKNESLKNHIDRVGIIFFKQNQKEVLI